MKAISMHAIHRSRNLSEAASTVPPQEFLPERQPGLVWTRLALNHCDANGCYGTNRRAAVITAPIGAQANRLSAMQSKVGFRPKRRWIPGTPSQGRPVRDAAYSDFLRSGHFSMRRQAMEAGQRHFCFQQNELQRPAATLRTSSSPGRQPRHFIERQYRKEGDGMCADWTQGPIVHKLAQINNDL
jgi:hypothetical protein